MGIFRKHKGWLALAIVVAIVGAACGGAVASISDGTATPVPMSTPTPDTVEPTPVLPSDSPAPTPDPTPKPTPDNSLTFTPGPEPSYDPQARFSDPFGRFTWRTDFSKHSIDYDEIFSIVPRDGIPALDRPRFVPTDPDPFWLAADEPVISLELNGDARAYPIQVLIWHEIVNDVVGGVPVIVTFCPLCNTALVFERTIDGNVHDFGTSGMLRFSDLVMYDRQTDTWWQQIGGEAIVGELTGTRLNPLPASMVSWKDFRTSFPGGQVLSRETGFSRDYGRNPYTGYDDINSAPFLFAGPEDNRLRPVERVATVDLGEEAVAYPFLELESFPVVNDTVGGTSIVVLFAQGTRSGLDSSVIAASRDVGATGVYNRVLDGVELTFAVDGDRFLDTETGSTWNIIGQATDGPLAGKALEPIIHANHFWFAWATFKPDTRIWRAPTAA